jgi:hypothetical protein
MRVLLAILLFAAMALAENFKLYLKDGSHHVVREYQVIEDRVRYYSVERSEFEELPLELVDLKKTDAERKTRVEEEKKHAAFDDAEEKFEREMAREIASVPRNPGVYFVHDGKMLDLKTAEVKVINDKKRSILKVMSPIPIVAGKSVLELAGDNANVVVPYERPNFYFRIDSVQRFGIIRMKPRKAGRQVAIWTIEPMTKLIAFDMELVDVFRQQLKDNLYKLWPTKPLSPGEYAVVQYVEGDGQIQVWDFRVPVTPQQLP